MKIFSGDSFDGDGICIACSNFMQSASSYEEVEIDETECDQKVLLLLPDQLR